MSDPWISGDSGVAEHTANPASPRAAADYLVALRPLLADATAARRGLVESVRALAADVRGGGPISVALAGAIGSERAVTFHDLNARLEAMAPPPPCEACHLTLGRWLHRLADCCAVLTSIGSSPDATLLRRVELLLAEAREYARGFNAEHARLMAELRDLVDAATARARLPLR